MIRKIDYGTDKKFAAIKILRENKVYQEHDVIIGKSILKINEKNNGDSKSILELTKDMNKLKE